MDPRQLAELRRLTRLVYIALGLSMLSLGLNVIRLIVVSTT